MGLDGKQNLIFYPPSNLSFRVKPETKIDRPQRCLIDNLWIAYNKIPRDNSYFVSVVNSLSHYFTDKNEDKKFKFYVVVQGNLQGVFQTWIEVVDSIKDFPTPLFKGFALIPTQHIHSLQERIRFLLGNTPVLSIKKTYQIDLGTKVYEKTPFC